ncbi:hypothetical protein [Henriciella sp.]|uniref:hypothetical protein n=1 Tax=Henriciella sp. TaxID=1968823 RepID=UPI00262E8601|nr:hypothetical protein [Henriciella sp.]
MIRSMFAGASLILLAAACTSSPDPETDAQAIMDADLSVEQTKYELAMGTVSSLIEAGNEQIAIDRLTQMLGDPGMSEAQMAEVLFKRAELRYGAGSDLEGAIADLKEIQADYADSDFADDASSLLEQAEAEYATLTDMLASGDVSPMERFEILFRLGRHQEASDLMLAGALEPDNEYLVDMYQIGYLCDGDELAGPVFSMTEPDGTQRNVQFCELGK